ncbi:tetratricopeptide repeat protein [Ancylobacter oerskovii]|uniref:Tetratricopeptide repeat protein n=1 Tax=Ancylobacter oerskovii TaxID=459519 RepID=A0ABW4YY83_9HYPH|nr:tetratricopeptide repeat protein [Ancylobacter oerskovii]MBS7541775.1 sel1 repeat family protein [Ancylobacter oerskovii]
MADDWISLATLKRLGVDEIRNRIAESPQSAARWVQAGALNGLVNAQLAWGQMLLDGTGTARDAATALRWFGIAAQAGSAEGLNMVGRCHEHGWGTPVDPARAADFYRQAAQKDDAWGQFNLAGLLLAGNGVPPDRRQALALYVRAARRGHAKAATMVGRYLENGWERPARPAAARRWYRRGAEGGDYRGQFDHGRLLLAAGRREEGLGWMRRSLENAVPAFCRLAGDGLRTSADPALGTLALLALKRACESGTAQDQRAYATALAEGLGGLAQPEAARAAFAQARRIEEHDRLARSTDEAGAARRPSVKAAPRLARAIRALLGRVG